jgi:type IV secretion system protein VirB3
LGLTRPPSVLGVSYTFAGLNMIISMFVFLLTSKLFYLMVMMPSIHGIAWLICLKEPRALELFIARSSRCSVCRNRFYFNGTNSYDNF